MYGYHLYTDILSAINEDIHKHCAGVGYRFGREMGRDFYTNTFESYWIDRTLDEKPLVVKVIDFTHENKSKFCKTHKESNDSQRRVKTISVEVVKNKTINIETIGKRFVPNFDVFRNEIKELNRLNHQNVVIIRDIILFDTAVIGQGSKSKSSTGDLSHVLMFIEFNNNNLKQKLKQIYKSKEYVTEEQSINWSTQIVRGLSLFQNSCEDSFDSLISGLAYLHSRAISHSNLKPSNILVFEDKRIGIRLKLSDYGLAMLFPIAKNVRISNYKIGENDLYRDPKIDETFSKLKRKSITKQSYSATKADIWSLAVIITEFKLQFHPLFKLFKRNLAVPSTLGNVYLEKVKKMDSSESLIDLLSKILIWEQNKRIDILEISRHQRIKDTLLQQRKATQVNIQSDDPNRQTVLSTDLPTDQHLNEDSTENIE